MNAAGRGVFGLLLALPIVMLGWGRVAFDFHSIAGLIDGALLQRLLNSLQLAGFTSLFAVVFALPVFVVHSLTPPSRRRWLQAAALLPFSVPPFAMASAWMTLAGWFENPGGRIVWGAESLWEQWLYSVPGAAFVLALCYWPVVFFYVALSGVPERRAYEAALLYLPMPTRLYRFWLPCLLQVVLIACALVFGLALLQFEAPSLLYVDVYPLEIYVQFSALLNEGAAFLLCLPYLLLVPFMAWIFAASRNLGRRGAEAPVQTRGPLALIVGAGCAACVVFGLSVVVPAGALLLHASSIESLWLEWTRQSKTVLLTIAYAASSSVVMFALGLWLCRVRARWERALWLLAGLACFVLPGILISASWLEFRSLWPGWLPRWAQTLTLIAGYAAHFWVVGFAAAFLFWNRYGAQQQEADALLTRSLWQRIRFLYAPAWVKYCPPILFMMGLFVWCDASVTTLLHPPGGETLTMRYFNLLHYGSEPRTAAVGLLLLLTPMALLLIGLFARMLVQRWGLRYE
ncbi:MAG: hypothetical protein P9L94_17380 [Candidatus Hinthialibacter antarcticus]|nr:hypothetical protein [Candidatus Hinthialibacter antarcticus]